MVSHFHRPIIIIIFIINIFVMLFQVDSNGFVTIPRYLFQLSARSLQIVFTHLPTHLFSVHSVSCPFYRCQSRQSLLLFLFSIFVFNC